MQLCGYYCEIQNKYLLLSNAIALGKKQKQKRGTGKQRIQTSDTFLKGTIKMEGQINVRKTQEADIMKERYKRVSFLYHTSRNIRNTQTKVNL